MGLLGRIKQLFGAAPAAHQTQTLSTQPMTTQAMGSAMPMGGDEVPAQVPDHIQIGAELGRGAMAVVHRAQDLRQGTEIAVKRLLLSAEYDPADLADVRARFLREARAARTLAHPDILRVYEVGESGGDAWISMELVHGLDLSHFVQHGQLLPVPVVLGLAVRVARALDYAHRQGVVHRDIKPANIMYDAGTASVKIMDFGIARIADGSRTRTGLVLGTPSYMAPEQLAGQTVDGRSDLYALGAVIYQLLTGRLPHQSESMARLMFEIANERVADVRELRPGLPEALAMVLALALEKRPELRYANGEDLAQDLETVIGQLDPDALPPRPASAASDVDPFGATQRIQSKPPAP